jgi:hypothetical protein
MQDYYLQKYIESSDDFRRTNHDKKSVENLYDLLYEMQKIERSKDHDLILSNIYDLLGYHKTAYEIFKLIADPLNRKDAGKLFAMKEMALSHKDNYIFKDLRLANLKKTAPRLNLHDLTSPDNNNNFVISNTKVVIFNKVVSDIMAIELPNNHIEDYFDKVLTHISWLGECKNLLIEFYNTLGFEDVADDDWYDSLDIYSIKISIDSSGKIFTMIASGDVFWSDHLLDIEIADKAICNMSYDG